MRRYLLAVLAGVPAVLGFGLALLLERNVLPNLLLLGRYQADLAGLATGVGVLLSLVGWGILALGCWPTPISSSRSRLPRIKWPSSLVAGAGPVPPGG